MGLRESDGNGRGEVRGLEGGTLEARGRLDRASPSVRTYIAGGPGLEAAAAELFGLLQAGVLRPAIGQRFALRDAAQAHKALEAGQTTGSTILLP